jgi:hypothetical protein
VYAAFAPPDACVVGAWQDWQKCRRFRSSGLCLEARRKAVTVIPFNSPACPGPLTQTRPCATGPECFRPTAWVNLTLALGPVVDWKLPGGVGDGARRWLAQMTRTHGPSTPTALLVTRTSGDVFGADGSMTESYYYRLRLRVGVGGGKAARALQADLAPMASLNEGYVDPEQDRVMGALQASQKTARALVAKFQASAGCGGSDCANITVRFVNCTVAVLPSASAAGGIDSAAAATSAAAAGVGAAGASAATAAAEVELKAEEEAKRIAAKNAVLSERKEAKMATQAKRWQKQAKQQHLQQQAGRAARTKRTGVSVRARAHQRGAAGGGGGGPVTALLVCIAVSHVIAMCQPRAPLPRPACLVGDRLILDSRSCTYRTSRKGSRNPVTARTRTPQRLGLF